MTVAAGLMSVGVVEDRRDGEQLFSLLSGGRNGLLCGPVLIQWHLHGLVSIQHDLNDLMSILHHLCGLVSVQWGLVGPVSIQHGPAGCVYARWDPHGCVSIRHDPRVPCPSRVAPWERHGSAAPAGLGWVLVSAAGAASPLPLLLLPWGPAGVWPDLPSEKPSWLGQRELPKGMSGTSMSRFVPVFWSSARG